MCCLPPRTQVRSYQCFFFGVFLASTEKSTERNELRNFYHFKICELSITLLNNNEVTKFVSCMCCVTPCSTNQPDTSLAWTRLTWSDLTVIWSTVICVNCCPSPTLLCGTRTDLMRRSSHRTCSVHASPPGCPSRGQAGPASCLSLSLAVLISLMYFLKGKNIEECSYIISFEMLWYCLICMIALLRLGGRDGYLPAYITKEASSVRSVLPTVRKMKISLVLSLIAGSLAFGQR